MSILDKLERKFGRSKLPNMMYVLVICYGVGVVFSYILPMVFSYLRFNPYYIFKGQIWRLLTFVFIPSNTQLFMALLTCVIYLSIAKNLEQVIGRFRLNFFLISGLIIEVLFGFLFYFIFHGSIYVAYVEYLSPFYLYAMLFVLFAMIFPDARFLFMFIIPIRGKWMIFITLGLYILEIAQAFLYIDPYYGWILVFMVMAAVVTVMVFMLSNNRGNANPRKNVVKMRTYQQAQRNESSGRPTARHKCAICGRTELTNPELDFRYCTKCAGNHEYCSEHLYTHVHVSFEGDSRS